MQSLSSILIVLTACLFVFLGFLIFSQISFVYLLLIMIPVILFGFYLNYDIRKMVPAT